MNDLYEAALKADENGTLVEWMVDYLNDSGRNTILAGGLQQDGQFHTRLIDYPIDDFKILMGPDHSFRYYEDPEKFNGRIEAMLESLAQGWKPVPFIASDIWNDGLELNDGAHRAEALKRFGVKTYPTVFFFKGQDELGAFLARFNSANNNSFEFTYKGVVHEAKSIGAHLPNLDEVISVHALAKTTDDTFVVVDVRSRGVDMAGGHVESTDATLLDALSRELIEEAEMTVTNHRLLDVLKVSSDLIKEGDRKYIVLYSADVDTLGDFTPTDEIRERLILTKEQFANQYFAHAPQYIKHLFAMI